MDQAEGPLRPARFYARPRIKFEHHPIRRTDGTIQIGGDIYGIASVIEDPDGWIWDTLGLIDGDHGYEEIVAASARPREDVEKLLEALRRSGFLEEAEHRPTYLTEDERERYSRTQAFYRWIDLTPRPSPWTVQERIRAASVVVIGLGGGGSSAAMALAATGVGRLHCVDFDRVELSNLTRQILYTEADLGRYKVEAAVRRLTAINSTVVVTGEELKITGVGELRRLAADHDVLALCADQPQEIHHWAAEACAATATPWVTGGYVGPVVQAQTFLPGTGACFECLHLRQAEASRSAPAALPDRSAPGGTDRPQPGNNDFAASTAVSAGIGGMLLAHAVLAHITGAPAFGNNFGFGLNLAAPGDLIHLAPEPHPDCPLCPRLRTAFPAKSGERPGERPGERR
jgi:molybdopterin/thiamine biosynthesis adenylyltransferase